MSIESIKDNIQKYGWQFQYVFDADGEKEGFSYSIGFEESFSHPEVMIFGLERETMHAILSDIATDIKNGRVFSENIKTKDVLSRDYEVEFRTIKEVYLPEYAGLAMRFYQKPFRMMVMFWPDKANVLPTEPNCTLTLQNEAVAIV